VTFIDVVPDGPGSSANDEKAFSLRPEAYAAWDALNGTIKSTMDRRRYELATLAAARRLRSSYCTLAHGSVLAQLSPQDDVQAIVDDFHAAGLEPVDVAIMELADTVARDATAVTEADVETLRGHGLSDAEILDVVLAAAARCFFSKVLDGLGVQADAAYAELDEGLRETLTVGRPIAGA
jgi:uncharacterized peroxidase-related enzyme